MMTLMNLVYALPLVIALVIAGAVVHGRVMGTARTLMWSGIAAVCLTRLAGMFLPALVTGGSMVAYGVANLILNVLATVGIVLLVVAVGVAARAVRAAVRTRVRRVGSSPVAKQRAFRPSAQASRISTHSTVGMATRSRRTRRRRSRPTGRTRAVTATGPDNLASVQARFPRRMRTVPGRREVDAQTSVPSVRRR